MAKKEHSERMFSEKNSQIKCKPKKKVRFNLEQGVVGCKPHTGTDGPLSFTAHSRSEKKSTVKGCLITRKAHRGK